MKVSSWFACILGHQDLGGLQVVEIIRIYSDVDPVKICKQVVKPWAIINVSVCLTIWFENTECVTPHVSALAGCDRLVSEHWL